MKIEQIQITRTYQRKITSEKQYEMVDLGSTYTATLNKPTEKQIDEVSEWIYQKAEKEVELQVDIRQNPGRVIRGYASIEELRTIVKAQTKKLEKQEEMINELKLKINLADKAF
jgi:hypothetical protein